MSFNSLEYMVLQLLPNTPSGGFCLAGVGTGVDWRDISVVPTNFSYRSGIDDTTIRIVDEKPVMISNMAEAVELYRNNDLILSGCKAERTPSGGCEPITIIRSLCVSPPELRESYVVAVYGYDTVIPLAIFHVDCPLKSISNGRWFVWTPDGSNITGHIFNDIDGVCYHSDCHNADSAEAHALKKTIWYKSHMELVRRNALALVNAYRSYAKDVVDLKVVDFCHGPYVFHIGESRSEVRFDQYHMSMPNTVFSLLVSKLVATDRYIKIGTLMDTTLNGVKGIQVGSVGLLYRHDTNKFTYINGIRINKEDVTSCLVAVTRFTNTEEYNKFLTNTNRTPIRLQTILRSGVLFKLLRTSSNGGIVLELKSLEMHPRLKKFAWYTVGTANTGYNAFLALAHNNSSSVSRVIEFPLTILKDYRKPARVIFLGKERQLDQDLDAFINFCHNHYGGSHLGIRFESSANTGTTARGNSVALNRIDFALVDRIMKMDRYFREFDRVIPKEYLVQSEYTGGAISKVYNPAETPEAQKFFEDLTPAFFIDFKSNIDEKLDGVVQSLNLLESTIKRYGIEEHKDDEGRVDYFLVTGESGSIYKVNLAGGVYRYKMSYDSEVSKTDEYICIDPAAGHGRSMDLGFNYTVSVMMALAIDSAVAPSIYTLESRLSRNAGQTAGQEV